VATGLHPLEYGLLPNLKLQPCFRFNLQHRQTQLFQNQGSPTYQQSIKCPCSAQFMLIYYPPGFSWRLIERGVSLCYFI